MRQNETADREWAVQIHTLTLKKKKKLATFSQGICNEGDILLFNPINQVLQTGFNSVCAYT